MNIKIPVLILLSLVTFAGCKKEEGKGGKYTIRGKVYTKNYDPTFTTIKAEYYQADERVYIIYGDDVSVGDDVRTNYDGTFEFKYLRKGNYKVFAYSKDSTLKSPTGDTAIVKEVRVEGSGKVITIPDIVIIK